MKKKAAKKEVTVVRKNIDLPSDVISDLKGKAAEKRMKVKPYMEIVLIDHSKSK